MIEQVKDHITSLEQILVALRRDLHANPELSFQEFKTAERVVTALRAAPGLQITTGIAGTGVVALLNGEKAGPCVALRADMDALPIEEQGCPPYRSKNPGVMHACGHDGHTTALVGTALTLARFADRIPGPVKFIFQPAEERGGGAAKMIEAGVLENPNVSAIFGMHGFPQFPLGTVGCKAGAVTASSDSFTIRILGKGSHAAFPAEGIDPIVASAHVISALQTIRARRIDPQKAVVVSIGSIKAGDAHNVIPAEATLLGTVRALDPETRSQAIRAVTEITTSTAEAFGAEAKVSFDPGYPPLSNSEDAYQRWQRAALTILPPEKILSGFQAFMGAEDFAFYAEKIPAAFWILGLKEPDVSAPPTLHDPKFDFNDRALPLAVLMHCATVLEFFSLLPGTR